MNRAIAYLILCHSDPEQLQRLIRALDQDAAFFVHVDAKVPLEPFQNLDLPNTTFASRRVRVYWGGFSIVDATLVLLEDALQAGEFQRLVLLTGLDYPIKPTQHIVETLTQSPQREYIRFFDITSPGAEYYLRKASGWWFFDAPRWLVNRHYDGRQLLTRCMRYFRRRLVRSYRHCFGHMQWALSDECARHVLGLIRRHRELTRFYQWAFAPDEHFFHTAVANSPFCSRAGGVEPYTSFGTARMANLHHIHPSLNKTYTHEDFEELAASDKLFTRKITSASSLSLISLIDVHLR